MYAELKQKTGCTSKNPCLKCKNRKKTKRAERRKLNPEAHKRKDFEQDLKKNYGMNFGEYTKLYQAQKGKCAICGLHESNFKRGLHVDHVHGTKIIRGLLCTRCNPGLGYFKDSQKLLKKAIAYLEKFKK